MMVTCPQDGHIAAHAVIRRLEAVSFRSFPSTTTRYDGTWAIRLTAGHPAKRLNSVNPLDPRDWEDLDRRIELAERRFAGFGRQLIFRLTPLAPVQLRCRLEELGWREFEESIVMLADLTQADLSAVLDHVPLKDAGKWIDCFLNVSGEDVSRKPGLAEIISSTQPETALFVTANESGSALSVVRCVQDLDLAGIFDLATAEGSRGRGHARRTLETALGWAQRKGASSAWLQVVADNEAALNLYRSAGFQESYRYSYWACERAGPGEGAMQR